MYVCVGVNVFVCVFECVCFYMCVRVFSYDVPPFSSTLQYASILPTLQYTAPCHRTMTASFPNLTMSDPFS